MLYHQNQFLEDTSVIPIYGINYNNLNSQQEEDNTIIEQVRKQDSIIDVYPSNQRALGKWLAIVYKTKATEAKNMLDDTLPDICKQSTNNNNSKPRRVESNMPSSIMTYAKAVAANTLPNVNKFMTPPKIKRNIAISYDKNSEFPPSPKKSKNKNDGSIASSTTTPLTTDELESKLTKMLKDEVAKINAAVNQRMETLLQDKLSTIVQETTSKVTQQFEIAIQAVQTKTDEKAKQLKEFVDTKNNETKSMLTAIMAKLQSPGTIIVPTQPTNKRELPNTDMMETSFDESIINDETSQE